MPDVKKKYLFEILAYFALEGGYLQGFMTLFYPIRSVHVSKLHLFRIMMRCANCINDAILCINFMK